MKTGRKVSERGQTAADAAVARGPELIAIVSGMVCIPDLRKVMSERLSLALNSRSDRTSRTLNSNYVRTSAQGAASTR